jgi:3D (Asp-Asp-Asp) domain-containing protein
VRSKAKAKPKPTQKHAPPQPAEVYDIYEAKTEVFEVTAYTAYEESTGKTPDHPAFGITASGRRVQAGITAACPRELPFGTWIEIEGVGKRRCDDRGGLIRGKKLDIYIPELTDALEFGRKRLKVRVVNDSF